MTMSKTFSMRDYLQLQCLDHDCVGLSIQIIAKKKLFSIWVSTDSIVLFIFTIAYISSFTTTVFLRDSTNKGFI